MLNVVLVEVVTAADGTVDAAVGEVSVVDVWPLPLRVTYTPSTAAATASTPTAAVRLGITRDFR